MAFRRLMMTALAMLMSLPAMMAMTSAANQDTGTTEVVVHVNLCVAAGCTELPEAIEPADSVEVTLSTVNDGAVLGTCVTGDPNPGTCVVALEQVPEMVMVEMNQATVPAGYVPDSVGVPYQLGPEMPEVWLLLYPADGELMPPPGEDATEVPLAPTETEPPVASEDDSPVPLPEPLALQLPTWLYGGTCADLESDGGLDLQRTVERCNDRRG